MRLMGDHTHFQILSLTGIMSQMSLWISTQRSFYHYQLIENVVTYTGELGIQNVLGIHEWYPWLLCKALRIFLSGHYVQQQFFHCCFPCILNIKSLIGLQNVGFKRNIKGKVFSPTSRQPPLRNPSQEIFENFEATSFHATAGRFRR